MSGRLWGASVASDRGQGSAGRGHLQGAEVREDQQARHIHQVSTVHSAADIVIHDYLGWQHSRVGSWNTLVEEAILDSNKYSISHLESYLQIYFIISCF